MEKVFRTLSLKVIIQSNFLLIVLSNPSIACSLKEKRYLLLSGPLTHVIQELGLEEHKMIKGYSSYFPINNQKAKVFLGGIFLSKSELQKHKFDVAFYDKSYDLEKSLKKSKIKKISEIDTLRKSPFEVISDTLSLLDKELVACEKKIGLFQMRVEKMKQALLKLKLKGDRKKFLFYLGEIQRNKYPKLLIVKDGMVKFLEQKSIVKTYPSELSYVSWSSKIRKSLKNYREVGLHTCESSEVVIKENSHNNYYNVCAKKLLTPGIGQLRAFYGFFKKLNLL